MVRIIVNGEPRRFDSPLTCLQLVERLQLSGRKLAIEKNGEIVPRSRHAEEAVLDGDRLEIVVAVGGG
jgi:sulfur carrier protein